MIFERSCQDIIICSSCCSPIQNCEAERFGQNFNCCCERHGEKDVRTIHSAEDVKDVIEKEIHLSYRIKVHTASDIQKVGEKLPKLGPLTRALQIHEIMITSNGQVRSKNLPSDVFYENVKTKESRRIQRVDDDA